MFRLSLVGMLGVLIAQSIPDDSSSAITTLIGSGITGGTVLAYAWWRQRHADELLKQSNALNVDMTKTMIDLVVPALEKTAAASNEMRAAMERIIEANRRGDYGHDDRRARDR